jgi:hypothetical protein
VGALYEGRAIRRQANWFIWSIWFISFISFSKPDKPKKPNKPDEPTEPAPRSTPRDVGLQDPQSFAPGFLFTSTSNDTNKNHYDRDDQEGMNESAHGVRGDNTQKPEDNHDDRNGLEHVASPFAISWLIVSLAAHCRLTNKSSTGYPCSIARQSQ